MKKPVTGHKNQLVSFYRNTLVPDGFGGSTNAPVAYWENTSALVEPLRSSRKLEANQDKLNDGFRFHIRQRIDKTVLVDDIVKYRNMAFTIHSSIPDLIYKEDLIIIAIATDFTF